MPDEDVRKYCESLKKKAEPPLQVHEVDSCVPRTPERFGMTTEDDPEGQDDEITLFKSLIVILTIHKITHEIHTHLHRVL